MKEKTLYIYQVPEELETEPNGLQTYDDEDTDGYMGSVSSVRALSSSDLAHNRRQRQKSRLYDGKFKQLNITTLVFALSP